jgi:hypothetical protein
MPTLVAAALVALFALFTAMPARADAALTSPQTLYLDTYRAADAGSSEAVPTSETLAGGKYYVATVSGTFSAFIPRLMSDGLAPFALCGTAEASATLPSPGRPESRVGQDAEMVFGRPSPGPCPSLPAAYSSFQVDTASGFAHPQAAGGPYTAPRSDHTYDYLLRGENAPAAFRQVDTYTRDNFGVLTITVRPATASDCAGNAACAASAVEPRTAVQPSLALPLPSRSCTSRRSVSIRVVTHRKDPVVAASGRFNGKRIRVIVRRLGNSRRLTTVIDMRGLPAGKVTIQLTARTRSGRILTGRRTYRTCTVRKPGGRPPL